MLSLAVVLCVAFGGAALAAGGEELDRVEVPLGETIVVDDLMDLTVNSMAVSKSEKYFGDSNKYSTYYSGEDHRFLLVHCTLLNTALEYYAYGNYIKNVRMVYKEKFEYEPVLLQNLPDKEYPTQSLWEIEPLVETTPIFFFKVPNVVASSSDALYLHFTVGETDYSCKIR